MTPHYRMTTTLLKGLLYTAVVGFFALNAGSYAQNTNATVSGVVTDSSGAAVPNATVTITNTDTGVQHQTETNDAGIYTIPALIPGAYQESAIAPGFEKAAKDGIQLHVEETVSLNFTLAPGAATQTITVQAGGGLAIETQSTSLANTIERTQVQETPLNGRNAMNLVELVPGVVPQGQALGTTLATQNQAGIGNFQIGGGIAGWNATFIDGAPVNGSGQNWQLVSPTQDSVNEFRVDLNSVSPQYGRFAGGVINFSTRAGANAFHGSAYDYLRNTFLDSNTFFNDRTHSPVPILIQNQYGGTIGGPIKRDKAFFFFSAEPITIATRATFLNYVPTPAEWSGDFRNSLATIANKGVSIDPTTGKQAVCNGVLNTICANEIDPTAATLNRIGYYNPIASNPQQLSTLLASGYDTTGVTGNLTTSEQYVTRIDYNISSKQSIFGRYTYFGIHKDPTSGPVAIEGNIGDGSTTRMNQIALGDNYTFSPSLNGTFFVSYTRFVFNNLLNSNGKFNMSTYGPAYGTIGSTLSGAGYATEPITFFDCSCWPNQPNGANNQQNNKDDVYSLSGSMIKVFGRHQITFGAEARRMEFYDTQSLEPSGNFQFEGENGVENLVQGYISGNPTYDNITVAATPSAFTYYAGLFVSDTFRATPKLTVNYGVRWEIPGSWHTREGDDTVLLPNAANPLGGTGELALTNSSAYPSSGQSEEHWHLFEPRLGAAYSATPSTVFRVGFGITAPCLDCGSDSVEAAFSPLSEAVTLDGTHLSNPFPNGVNLPLLRNLNIMQPYTAFPRTLLGTVVGGQDPFQTFPYVMQWNANIEKSINSSTTALLSYVGSRGVHLGTQDINVDQLPDQYDSLGPALLTQVTNPYYGLVSPTSTTLNGPTTNAGNLLIPHPQFSRFVSFGKFEGTSSYNALIAQITKRFSSGSAISANYTWAHFLTNMDSSDGYLESGEPQTGFGAQDYTNPAADYSNSAGDIRNRAIVSYVLALPVGRGRRFLADAGPVVNRIVSGWELSGISTFQGGLPVGFTANSPTILETDFGAGVPRPNVVPGVKKAISGSPYKRITEWFNTSAYTAPNPYGFGNETRLDSTVRAQGVDNTDAGFTKITPIKESVSLQFRAEFFNIFNHPQFAPPNSAVGSANFGHVTTQLNQPRIGQLSLRLTF